MLYGRESVNLPSRFLNEIDESLLEIESSNINNKDKIVVNDMYLNAEVDYQVGDVVMHTVYGKGVVVGVDKSIVTIAFHKKYGIRKLMKNHKSLKKIN